MSLNIFAGVEMAMALNSKERPITKERKETKRDERRGFRQEAIAKRVEIANWEGPMQFAVCRRTRRTVVVEGVEEGVLSGYGSRGADYRVKKRGESDGGNAKKRIERTTEKTEICCFLQRREGRKKKDKKITRRKKTQGRKQDGKSDQAANPNPARKPRPLLSVVTFC